MRASNPQTPTDRECRSSLSRPLKMHPELQSQPNDVISLVDLEAAINFWRLRDPSIDGCTLTPALSALAEIYAQMTLSRVPVVNVDTVEEPARQAWLTWYHTTSDTPCIAICSTSQGDAVCKGCGRTEIEVQAWPAMSPYQKRATWHRIESEGTAWRFNRYSERIFRVGTDPHI